jgi:hypothetical protein
MGRDQALFRRSDSLLSHISFAMPFALPWPRDMDRA